MEYLHLVFSSVFRTGFGIFVTPKSLSMTIFVHSVFLQKVMEINKFEILSLFLKKKTVSISTQTCKSHNSFVIFLQFISTMKALQC